MDRTDSRHHSTYYWTRHELKERLVKMSIGTSVSMKTISQGQLSGERLINRKTIWHYENFVHFRIQEYHWNTRRLELDWTPQYPKKLELGDYIQQTLLARSSRLRHDTSPLLRSDPREQNRSERTTSIHLQDPSN